MNELVNNNPIDVIERAILELPPVELPLKHYFTPGLYIREIFMPAGAVLTSMEHKTEHPFIISHGLIRVYSDNEGPVVYQAPYTGITKPGTRRVLHALEDTIWTTIHANPDNIQDPDEIGEMILGKHANPLIDPDNPRLNLWRKDHFQNKIEQPSYQEVLQ